MKEITDLRKMILKRERTSLRFKKKTGFDPKTIRKFINKKD